jgi:hypothetical protein
MSENARQNAITWADRAAEMLNDVDGSGGVQGVIARAAVAQAYAAVAALDDDHEQSAPEPLRETNA